MRTNAKLLKKFVIEGVQPCYIATSSTYHPFAQANFFDNSFYWDANIKNIISSELKSLALRDEEVTNITSELLMTDNVNNKVFCLNTEKMLNVELSYRINVSAIESHSIIDGVPTSKIKLVASLQK